MTPDNNPYQPTVDLANEKSDIAISQMDADAAFRLRDIGRAWEIMGKVQAGAAATDEERAFMRAFIEAHKPDKETP